MSKHSEGPWKWNKTHYGYSIGSGRYSVGGCARRENAYLIAAAPELLEICEFMIERLDWTEMAHSGYDRIEKVMNKAKGKEIDV